VHRCHLPAIVCVGELSGTAAHCIACASDSATICSNCTDCAGSDCKRGSILAVNCSRSRELTATSAAGVETAEPSRLAAIVRSSVHFDIQRLPCRDTPGTVKQLLSRSKETQLSPSHI
jgi:hypothetical protein